MIPILYNKTETTFTSLGLGALTDAISCEVSQTLNGAYELTMQYPQSGARFADLCNECVIKATAEKGKPAQLFIIYCITKPINGIVTINAIHISGRKEYIPVMPCSASNVGDALAAVKANSAETNPFTMWTNKTTQAGFAIGAPLSLGQALGGTAGSILDVYGGEYEFDNFIIKLWNNRGADNGVSLRYGKNITDFKQEDNISSTITGICPYWADSEGHIVTLPEKTVDSPSASNFAYKRTIVKDFSKVWQTQPTEAELRAYAQTYVAQSGIGVPKVSITVKFENLADYDEYKDYALLETVHLGDTIHVYFEPLDVTATARVVKTRYNSLLDKYTSIDVGSIKTDMSKVINDVETRAEEQTSTSINYLEEAFDKALKDLSGAEGGNVVIRTDSAGKPYEILIMDTDDVTTAVKVLRLNQNGMGYSESGISGPYEAAITGSGIVANSITSGTLNSNVIGAGSITAEKINVTDLSALSATIGGYTIDADSVYSGDKNPATLSGCGMSKNGANYAFWSVGQGGSYFRVGNDGILQAAGATISGAIVATSGSFTNGTFTNCTISNNCTVNGSVGAGGLTINNGGIRLSRPGGYTTQVISGTITGSELIYNEVITIGGSKAHFEFESTQSDQRIIMVYQNRAWELDVDSDGFVKGTRLS